MARRGFGLGHESCPVSSFLPWATAASQAVAVETPNGVSGHKALKSQQPASEAVQPCAVEHGVPALGCLAGSGQSQTASMALNSLRSFKVNDEQILHMIIAKRSSNNHFHEHTTDYPITNRKEPRCAQLALAA